MTRAKFGISSKILSRSTNESKNKNGNKQHLAISSPVGPIKTSRGIDLTRSDTFTIVDAINNCGSESREKTTATPAKLARRISATLRKENIVYSASSVTVSKIVAPNSTLKSGKRTFSFTSLLPKSKLPDSSSTNLNLLNIKRKPLAGEENRSSRMVATSKDEAVKQPGSFSKLPRARTMQSLCEVQKAHSLSVSETAPVTNIPETVPEIVSTRFISRSKPILDTSSSTNTLDSIAQSQCGVSQSSMSSVENVTKSASPQLSFSHVGMPQPSEYWTGRFVSVHDRFCGERLPRTSEHQSVDALTDGSSKYTNPQGRNHRMAYLRRSHIDASHDTSDRVFSYLDSLCTTNEAKASLRHWQAGYARKTNRPSITPTSSRDERPGVVSRFFAPKKPRQVDRRSREFLDEIYYSNSSNAFGLTNAYGVDGRYLSFR